MYCIDPTRAVLQPTLRRGIPQSVSFRPTAAINQSVAPSNHSSSSTASVSHASQRMVALMQWAELSALPSTALFLPHLVSNA
mmetsp:Transcript_73664/g.146478  ORF Transcript_73664/g.146478 Transcript_73664/m.146478 type:complete len:82 (+) Transcript_73664:103-348(+)